MIAKTKGKVTTMISDMVSKTKKRDGGAVSKTVSKKKNDSAEAVSKAKKTISKRPAKKRTPTKEDLVGQVRKHKKEIQVLRFGLSKEAQQGAARRNLRKQIARTATQLTALKKGVSGSG